MPRQQKRIISSFILVAMMAAFLLKAMIPAGFMPESKNGFVELVICSGMGEKIVLVPSDEAPSEEQHQDTESPDVCSYQLTASAKIILPSLPVLAFTPVYGDMQLPTEGSTHASSADRLSFEARGPPAA